MLRKSGQLAEAESLFRDSLTIFRARLGDENVRVATTLNNLALVLEQRGNLPEAETVQRECTNIREKKIPDDGRTFSSRCALGGILLEEKQFAAAEPLLLSGYEGLKLREDKLTPRCTRRPLQGGRRLTAISANQPCPKWMDEPSNASSKSMFSSPGTTKM